MVLKEWSRVSGLDLVKWVSGVQFVERGSWGRVSGVQLVERG